MISHSPKSCVGFSSSLLNIYSPSADVSLVNYKHLENGFNCVLLLWRAVVELVIKSFHYN